ncbi:hypothetical protein A3C59_03075 [Candidatus Daviesbacteria bacterium RIFCSPHIGHO2_02_FULL_36_13]|uniref:NusB/RsmB/TIM44 domain-containing protein n=1 Tax=Candidatus Daviesbacteria bacterium RIFCSPHIGHO2_02_FULL_36_13 TaxID=1797768 RepID=A0A1F5JPQ6_9BACT|nr:MAG: hypothetical protein A3C59_03075 [Candidatus Daviesbacteria bacterium RIFCSPHIGHO2_02_FULL_36_13]OGE44652.1 MAG: hypothetical protein A3A45_02250 [Candidatus Daviesbacteria bacterium RIFCSPLOWO2_01_FULL_36_8]
MKTSKDPRHLKRIKIIQDLFSWSFSVKKRAPSDIKEIVEHLSEIDSLIEKSAPNRPLTQINRIDLAILRNSIFELIIKGDTPPKVVVDEAVELGKEFGSDSTSSFVNGALGKLIEIKKIRT